MVRANVICSTKTLGNYRANVHTCYRKHENTYARHRKKVNTMDIKTKLPISGLTIDWKVIPPYSYLRQIPSLKGVRKVTFHQPVTFFVGENGSGKSTLLEAIALAFGFNPEGGTINYNFSTYDSHSKLYEALRLIKSFHKTKNGYFLRAESFYNVATAEEEYDRGAGGSPLYLHQQSHGESFFTIIEEYFKEDGVYLLDEPEAALSPQRQLALLRTVWQYAKQGSQFIIVTHSPILLGLPDAEILTFDQGRIHPCAYEETDSYKVMAMFINHRETLLNKLLEE